MNVLRSCLLAAFPLCRPPVEKIPTSVQEAVERNIAQSNRLKTMSNEAVSDPLADMLRGVLGHD